MNRDAELQLIRRVAAGDREAFEALYLDYHGRLARFLGRVTRRTDLVDEILNDVMLVVWRRADRFREESRLSTWIFGIGYRVALKRLRRERADRELPVEEANLVEPGRQQRRVERRELRERLESALERLSPDHRAVVELTFFNGYAYREIARIVGCPENTVKTRMFHARKRLRELLSDLDARDDSRGAL